MLFVSFILFLVDRLIKLFVIKNFHPGESLTIITNFLNITYVKNTGIAFGWLNSLNKFSIISVNVAILILCYIFFVKTKNKIAVNCFYFIAIGALSNIFDRIFYGHVIDFIDISLFNTFPTFNLADCMIVFAVIILSSFSLKMDIFYESSDEQN